MLLCLSQELLDIVISSIYSHEDHGSLLACALANRELADICVPMLYKRPLYKMRMYDGTDGDACSKKLTEDLIKYWRSIILSSIGKTMYPYCQYINTLHLRLLRCIMLEFDSECGSEFVLAFFQGDMSIFYVPGNKTVQSKSKSPHISARSELQQQPDKKKCLILILSALFQRIFPDEETNAMKQQVSFIELPKPRFPKLKELSVPLTFAYHMNRFDKNDVRKNCPILEAVSIRDGFVGFDWFNDSGKFDDEEIITFTSNLGPGSLTSLKFLNCGLLNIPTWSSLTCFCNSMTSLTLPVCGFNTVQHLPKYPNLKKLSVKMLSSSEGLDIPHSDGMASWLGHCKRLEILKIKDYYELPSVITNLLLNKEIPLKTLHIGYSNDTLDRNFCRALSTRISLTELSIIRLGFIRRDIERDEEEHINLMESLLCLGTLSRLHVTNAIYLKDCDIATLARQFPRLKMLTFSCVEIIDEILSHLSGMACLCEVTLEGRAKFTLDGLLSFVSKLGLGNGNMAVNIVVPFGSPHPLTLEEIARVDESMKEKVKGAFHYDIHY